jgi:predicted alpha/beta superfamily hydrolase
VLEHLMELPWNGYTEPSRTVAIPGYPFEHEVRVWLPPSYHHHPERTYPVLWMTDNGLETGRVASHGNEFVIVAIGSPQGTPFGEFQRRRTYDFLPGHELLVGEHYRSLDETGVGGAPAFRDFLVDTLRPALAAEYRMDPAEHGLAGGSGGAMFGLFVLLTRPDAFSRYVVASPAEGVDFLRLEKECAAEFGDIPARVLIGAGADELTDPLMARAGIVSTGARVAQALSVSGYPSLELTATVLPDENHSTAYRALLSRAVRELWRERAQAFAKALAEAQ